MSGIRMSLEQAAAATGGCIVQRGAPEFEGLSIDSRRLERGQAFLAVAGERFDGHDFWRVAVEEGASLLIVGRPLEAAPPVSVSVLEVADPRRALGLLARAWRREVAPAVVAITGSVGKTTTKELTRGILAQAGATHSTSGNFNNDIGLPLTLLAMPRGTRYLVAELGMNAPGEIAYLAGIAEPDVGLITCVAPVHLAGLGSLAGVAAAKGELLGGLRAGGFAIVPGGESLLEPHLSRVPAERRVRFGERAGDDVRLLEARGRGAQGTELRLSLRGDELEAVLPLPGVHNARNAAAAAAVGLVLGVPSSAIAAGLATPPSLSHRSAVREVGGFCVFDDCYNANPVAVRAALETLRELGAAAQRIAVLGSMLELGAESERYHLEVGRHAGALGLDLLITVGPLAAAIAAGAREAGLPAERLHHADSASDAAQALLAHAAPGAWILVKASRGARLESVIDELKHNTHQVGPK